MKFTIVETEFDSDHSIILSDQYELKDNVVFKMNKDKQDLFLHWNGFVSQIHLEQVGLNKELLQSLGWKAGDVVDMIKVEASPVEWVTVIPKTLHDWSVIQLQAEFLQDQILAQITIVSIGMEIPLRTRDGSIVRVIVDGAYPHVDGALKLTFGVEIRIVPLKRVDAFTKELRVVPNVFPLENGAWSKIYTSSDCQLKDSIVKINIIPFLQSHKSLDIYAIVDISRDLLPGQVMFSNGFLGVSDYEIVRYVIMAFLFFLFSYFLSFLFLKSIITLASLELL
jgi:hypothetical protein